METTQFVLKKKKLSRILSINYPANNLQSLVYEIWNSVQRNDFITNINNFKFFLEDKRCIKGLFKVMK